MLRGSMMAQLLAAFGGGVMPAFGGTPPPHSQGPRLYSGGRGKGRGTPSRNYGNRSFHTPHQGAQECIRRALGGFAAPRGNPGFTKRRLLDAIERGTAVTFNDAREFKYGN